MTPQQIIAHRRVRLLEQADELGNVSAACRQMGVSRTRYYQWRREAAAYGLEALTPKGRRRSQRLARVAAIAAATTGLITEPAAEGPFGFCHWAARPGDLVALDSFDIGHLKGVGKVYQLTAVDTATRWALVAIVLGTPNGVTTARFLDRVIRRFRRLGVDVGAVLTDTGPEYIATGFRAHVAARGLVHRRIPPRSPNHNAVCERFQGTALQECWRPAFHRRSFHAIGQLQAEADAWLVRYNHHRRNHGEFMRGRTPRQVLDTHLTKRAA